MVGRQRWLQPPTQAMSPPREPQTRVRGGTARVAAGTPPAAPGPWGVWPPLLDFVSPGSALAGRGAEVCTVGTHMRLRGRPLLQHPARCSGLT